MRMGNGGYCETTLGKKYSKAPSIFRNIRMHQDGSAMANVNRTTVPRSSELQLIHCGRDIYWSRKKVNQHMRTLLSGLLMAYRGCFFLEHTQEPIYDSDKERRNSLTFRNLHRRLNRFESWKHDPLRMSPPFTSTRISSVHAVKCTGKPNICSGPPPSSRSTVFSHSISSIDP